MGMLKEFKEFAMRGNVVDMAVGVIIGGAFGKIVTSLVNDLLMPLISGFIGKTDFTELKLALNTTVNEAGEEVTTYLSYGNFIQVVVDFLIVAFCIFMVIKGINKLSNLKKKEEEAPAEPEAPAPKPDDVVLLEEIRDLLKKQK